MLLKLNKKLFKLNLQPEHPSRVWRDQPGDGRQRGQRQVAEIGKQLIKLYFKFVVEAFLYDGFDRITNNYKTNLRHTYHINVPRKGNLGRKPNYKITIDHLNRLPLNLTLTAR